MKYIFLLKTWQNNKSKLTEISLDIYSKIFHFLFANYIETCVTNDTRTYMKTLSHTNIFLSLLHIKERKHK